ncbi:MAG: hypothetical protein H7Y10_03435 [Flavobacterium sp.]|nr:hypothetical protein [Flavobacterium sp.]
MRNTLKIEVVDGRWTASGTLIDLFINSHRKQISEPLRAKIDKRHNYKFNTRNY